MGWKILPVSVLLIVAAVRCERKPRYVVRIADANIISYAVAAVDIDGDSSDERYGVCNYIASARDVEGRFLLSHDSYLPRGSSTSTAWAVDLGDDSVPDIVVTAAVPGSLFVFVENVHGRRLRRFVVDAPPKKGERQYDGGIPHAAFADLDSDGVKEMVAGVVSGFAWQWQPRSVTAVDLVTGERLWRFGMGTQVWALAVGDVDGDGRPETYVGGSAPCNGCVENGFADHIGYVFSFDDRGGLRWSIPAEDDSSAANVSIALAESPDDGGQVLVANTCSNWASDSVDRLMVIDPEKGTVLRGVPVRNSTSSFVTLDATGDGVSDIVTIERDRVVVRDLNLRTVSSTPAGVQLEHLWWLGYIIPGAAEQILVSTRDGHLLVWDPATRRRTSAAEGGAIQSDWRVVPVRRSAGRPGGFMVHDGVTELTSGRAGVAPIPRWQFYQLVAIPLPFPWPWAASTATALLLLAATALLYSRASYREFVRYVTRGMVERAGIVMFSSRGRVTSINKRATELLVLPKGVRTGVLEGLLTQPSFASLRAEFPKVKEGRLPRAVADVVLEVDGVQRTFRAALSRLRLGGYLLSLEDLAAVEYARKVGAWGPVAQRLAHGIKTPLSTIRLTAQAMEGVDPDGAKVIEEEVDRLAKMTDGFMRLADFEPPRLEAKDINAVVRRALDELGVASLRDIELKLDLAEGLPAVQLDEEQVVRALGNLVNNAVGAMGGKGRLAVATRRAESAAEVVVAVTDSGPGIPPDYLAKLFQPFFTRKAGGTGLGLTIVRKVAEDHGGRVEVESEPGKGATFRFVLPVSKVVA